VKTHPLDVFRKVILHVPLYTMRASLNVRDRSGRMGGCTDPAGSLRLAIEKGGTPNEVTPNERHR
jgi:hypothetical protein